MNIEMFNVKCHVSMHIVTSSSVRTINDGIMVLLLVNMKLAMCYEIR